MGKTKSHFGTIPLSKKAILETMMILDEGKPYKDWNLATRLRHEEREAEIQKMIKKEKKKAKIYRLMGNMGMKIRMSD